ncbi:MAG: hypothetical protein JKY41_14565 [Rhodobacteraceae bacterium]|nr:hypothetical protein [Paracoccaceae bacterium]
MIAKLVNFFGDSKYTRIRWRLLLVILALIVIADFLIDRHETENFWDAIPGWGAAFGFASCAAIIFISKFIGHKGGIMKDEDYYD